LLYLREIFEKISNGKYFKLHIFFIKIAKVTIKIRKVYAILNQKIKTLLFSKEAKRYKYLYYIIKKYKCRRIMEIGVWNGNHAIKMIEKAKKYWEAKDIEYYGFDLFEDLSEKMLKEEISKQPPFMNEVKKKLEKTGARIQLYKVH